MRGSSRSYGALALAAFRGREDELTRSGADQTAGLHRPRRGDGTHRVALGDRRALQRPRRATRRRSSPRHAGDRGPARALVLDLCVGRADRGRQPQRPRSAAATALDVLSESTRASGTPVGTRASRRDRGPSCIEAMPPSRSTARRSTGSSRRASASTWPGRICSTGSGCDAKRRRIDARDELRSPTSSSPTSGWRLRRARPGRAAGDGRARPQADRRHPRPAHAAGGADLAPRGAGTHEPRDRRAAVHQPEHRRVPPAQGVPKLDVTSRTAGEQVAISEGAELSA